MTIPKLTLEKGAPPSQGFISSLQTSWRGRWVDTDFKVGFISASIALISLSAIVIIVVFSRNPSMESIARPAFAGAAALASTTGMISFIFLQQHRLNFSQK